MKNWLPAATAARKHLGLAILISALLAGWGCSRSPSSSMRVVIKGSDTMVQVMSNLAEAYSGMHPQARIAVTGGGSGTGIAALLNGTTDICAASRPLLAEELHRAESLNIHPQTTVIGRDGVSIIVNNSNPVSELTIDQIKKIYTGEYTNWQHVGGADEPILVLARDNSSGTFLYFQEHVMGKADYRKALLVLPSNSAVTRAVGEDATTIGYAGLAYAVHASVKLLRIKAATDSTAYLPSQETVDNGHYPLSRPLMLITNGASGGEAQKFIAFCLSEAGQKIVTETGYVTVPRQP